MRTTGASASCSRSTPRCASRSPARRPARSSSTSRTSRSRAAIAHDTLRLYLLLAGGLALLYLALFRIVAGASTRLRRQSTENEYLALHDTLTGLPNRSLFHERAGRAILSAQRTDLSVALVLLDLDRFKEVNDTLGHQNGDLLLQEIGGRLRAALRESDTVARLGGDEFGLLLPTVLDDDEALRVAEKVRAELRRPFELQGVRLDLEASIGIALYPKHGARRRHAAAARRRRHVPGQGRACGLRALRRRARRVQPEQARARRRAAPRHRPGELFLHYQPKADLARRTGSSGVEALVRWQHPDARRCSRPTSSCRSPSARA